MMKVCVLGYNPTKIGGIESFSRNLKEIINYTVEFVYEYNEQGPFEIDGKRPVLEYNKLNRFFNKVSFSKYSLYKIKRQLSLGNYDVVIANSPKYLDVIPNLNKVILVQHTTVENMWSSKFKFNKNKKLLELSRQVYKIISLSDLEREALITKFGYQDNKVFTINMINTLPIRRKISKPKKSLVMLTRFQNEIKRLDLVINAMKLLPDFQLNIYGNGIDEDYLKEISEDLSNVNVYPATTDKQYILDNNGIYVISSEFEGFPVSLLEALSRGLPVIVRNSFLSAPCFIKNNGVLLDKEWSDERFCEAVNYCYENYEMLSANSILESSRYSKSKLAPIWNQLISELYRI
ncbi:glycosyltransferase [Grimontia hollisae]|uniref:UDP-D-galactose:(Glucosyl)lipopolysaccharide-1,6-D-galactosyltransferase n=1 Tax=Grimontia hollisae TaxID=673 RepID=A0A377HL49_GRIHO|nr:glycosyltransferase [Grimontia hollisae]STO56907.1 UDP-D-galactose:(glucosyl)lipopolysaccharide-1,6-D-galactosyltransferase [Grimontia hollisae]